MYQVFFEDSGNHISIDHFDYGLFRSFNSGIESLRFDLLKTRKIGVKCDDKTEEGLRNLLS